ncbi:MAG: 50S ribosomal protein L11 [Candidatus Woesearchaeota archaeon]
MAKDIVEVLIQGGKATAAPPLGPALGPKGVNIGKVVADINAKTKDYAGMSVPVKVIIDTDDKSYTIEIGTPPATALIMKELDLKKGASKIGEEFVGDLTFEQVLKIVRMKQDALTGKTMKEKSKEIIGTCRTMGVKIDGKTAKEITAEISEGKYDSKF